MTTVARVTRAGYGEAAADRRKLGISEMEIQSSG